MTKLIIQNRKHDDFWIGKTTGAKTSAIERSECGFNSKKNIKGPKAYVTTMFLNEIHALVKEMCLDFKRTTKNIKIESEYSQRIETVYEKWVLLRKECW